MVVVHRLGPRRVGFGIVLWAIAVNLCLFIAWTGSHAGIPPHSGTPALFVAAMLTAGVGVWIGWRHRVGTAFFAPLLAWAILVPFAFASEIIQVGFFAGLWHGLLSAVFGGFVAASLEGVFLVTFAVVGRIFSGVLGQRGDTTSYILPPPSR